jgi:hypothetical protein
MRLTKKEEAEATAELLARIEENPGIRTSDLAPSKKFRGKRTLRPDQIMQLLRAAGLTPTQGGEGKRTFHTWTRKPGKGSPFPRGFGSK